jgi:hypothetical protein
MLLTQLPATPDIVFVPPPEELPELEEELLEELGLSYFSIFTSPLSYVFVIVVVPLSLRQLWC